MTTHSTVSGGNRTTENPSKPVAELATPNRVSCTLYGFTGTGATLKEAKEDARRQTEQALSADYKPRVIIARAHVALIWNTPTGPTYCIGDVGQPIDASRACHVYPAGTNLDEVERDARRHLAQMEFVIEGHTVLWTGANIIKDEADKADHLRWCEWQSNYRKWREAGADDLTAHANAAGGPPPGQAAA
jgi:hypothetical protein